MTSSSSTPSPSSSSSSSSSSFWSWDYWQDQFDQQRLERLQQCNALQKTLKACEAKHRSSKSNKAKKNKAAITTTAAEEEGQQLDQYGGGIRMLKYYGWRDIVPVNQKGCVPERHSMWTCRAIALGCGKQIGLMKDCFQQVGLEGIMNQRKTAYEIAANKNNKNADKDSNINIPCYELQRALGECVSTNAKKLEEKIKSRQQQQQQSSK